MSDDDKLPKDNTSHKPKPTFSADMDEAPRGSVGFSSQLATPGLGGGSRYKTIDFTVHIRDDPEPVRQPELTPEEARADYLRNLPEGTEFTKLTGDKEVDQKSHEDGNVPVTDEEFETLKAENAQPEGVNQDAINPSEFASSFARAAGRSEELSQSHNHCDGQDLE